MEYDPLGGPAFPIGDNASFAPASGMTLLDYFAGQALAGLLASDDAIQGFTLNAQKAADYAYGQAEVMIAERQKRMK